MSGRCRTAFSYLRKRPVMSFSGFARGALRRLIPGGTGSCDTEPVRASEAEDALRQFLEVRGLGVSGLTAEQAVEGAIAFFESVRFDDVEAEERDGDMLLFQWGTYDWRDGAGPSFQFDLARQFIIAGSDPEDDDDAMWQLHLTLHYAPTEATAAVGAGHRWCHRVADAGSFGTFIRSTPAMAVAAGAPPDRVEIGFDQAG
jgi:hypothetical protein